MVGQLQRNETIFRSDGSDTGSGDHEQFFYKKSNPSVPMLTGDGRPMQLNSAPTPMTSIPTMAMNQRPNHHHHHLAPTMDLSAQPTQQRPPMPIGRGYTFDGVMSSIPMRDLSSNTSLPQLIDPGQLDKPHTISPVQVFSALGGPSPSSQGQGMHTLSLQPSSLFPFQQHHQHQQQQQRPQPPQPQHRPPPHLAHEPYQHYQSQHVQLQQTEFALQNQTEISPSEMQYLVQLQVLQQQQQQQQQQSLPQLQPPRFSGVMTHQHQNTLFHPDPRAEDDKDM